MTSVPSITLVVPVYNGARYLRTLLESVRAQTSDDWVCLCVDDGSTDGSPEILREFAVVDPRFRVVVQENAGCGAARNVAIARATSPYLLFADQDDVLHPQAFACARALIERTDADAVCFEAAPFTARFEPPSLPERFADIPLRRRTLPPELQFVKPRTGHSIFVWRHVWRRAKIAGVPFPPLSGGEDSVWMVELGWRGVRIADAPVVLYGNRHHGDSGSRGLSKRYIDSIFRSYDELRACGVRHDIDRVLLGRFLFRLEFWFVVSAFYHGLRSGCYALRKSIARRIAHSPSRIGQSENRRTGKSENRVP